MMKRLRQLQSLVREHRGAVVLFGCALACRLTLIACGGLRFWADEHRFQRGMAAFSHLSRGSVRDALQALFFQDHVLIGPLSLLCVPFQALASLVQGKGLNWDALVGQFWMAAAILALFSVGNVVLVYALTLRLGAGRGAALLAAVLAAASASLTAYSRHLLSYDTALFFGLLGIAVGMSRSVRAGRWVSVGVLAGCAYMTYNGYYVLPVMAIAVPFARRLAGLDSRVRWSGLVWIAVGGGVAALAVNGIALAVKGRSYLDAMVAFSQTVVQGSFGEGWAVPWAYLWSFEKGLLLLCAVGCVGACVGRRRGSDRCVYGALLLVALPYALIVLFSTVLHKFVVYGRTARVLVPGICILSGMGLTALVAGTGRHAGRCRVVLFVSIALFGVHNLLPLFAMQFPLGVEKRVAREYGAFDRDSTFLCAEDPRDDAPGGSADYVLFNTDMPCHPLGVKKRLGLAEATPLVDVAHPFSFVPFRFEVATPKERGIWAADEPRILLYRRCEIGRGP